MESEHDIPQAQAPAVLAEIQLKAAEAPPSPPLTDEQREARQLALEQASAELLRNARRWDNRVRWENSCLPGLQSSDWNHAGLTPHRPAIDRVLAYQLGSKGILASGLTGRGKTRAMWSLMYRLGVIEGHDLRYWSATDWFATLQDKISYGRDDARGWVETVARRQVVFIDDLGQEAVTKAREDWAQSWFFRFLDIRVGEKLPLFVTTNLKSEQMSARGGSVRGDPLVRRLLDLCEAVAFETEPERALRVARQTRKP